MWLTIATLVEAWFYYKLTDRAVLHCRGNGHGSRFQTAIDDVYRWQRESFAFAWNPETTRRGLLSAHRRRIHVHQFAGAVQLDPTAYGDAWYHANVRKSKTADFGSADACHWVRIFYDLRPLVGSVTEKLYKIFFKVVSALRWMLTEKSLTVILNSFVL